MAVAAQGPWEGLTIAQGRYCELTTLGEGGMGYVYRAKDRHLGTFVVIKSPRQALVHDPDQIARFMHEVGAMVKLSYPHVVPVLDVGRHEGVPFAVMRFLSGGNLADRMQHTSAGHPKAMSVESLSSWLLAIAKALDFVHAQKYLHRDVKPQNILFDEHGNAYLSDFGISRVLNDSLDARNSRLTAAGFIVGTVEYMAPELLSGEAVDGRADQYALAATVFEVLSGTVPFSGNSAAAVMVQQLNSQPVPLANLVPQVPAAISQAVAVGLAKSPADRFPTCSAFAAAVLAAPAAAMRQPAHEPMSPPKASQAGRATSVSPLETPPPRQSPTVSSAPAVARRAVASAPKPGQSVASIIAAIGLLAVSCGAFGFYWYSQAGSVEEAAAETLPPNPLPRLLHEWNELADRCQRSLVIDSKSILDNQQYADADELNALLKKQAERPSDQNVSEIDQLDESLASMKRLRSRRAAEVDKQIERRQDSEGAGSDAVRDELHAEQRALRDQESTLVALGRRLEQLRRALDESSNRYDAEATAELAALREMTAANEAKTRPQLSKTTRDRTKELSHARNRALASMATEALARNGDATAARDLATSLPDVQPQRQAELCWSLLLSGQRESIAETTRFLESHSDLVARMDRMAVFDLFAADPEAYSAAMLPWARWCKTSDERLRLFAAQAVILDEPTSQEIEQACDTGLLRGHVNALVAEVVKRRRERAYGLVQDLLQQHPETKLDLLEPDDLTKLFADEPRLASRLAEQAIAQGPASVQQAALTIYRDPGSKVSDAELGRLFGRGPAHEPTALVNDLLPDKDPKSLALAEVVLVHAVNLDPETLKFTAASDELLKRPAARAALVKLAAKVPERGRSWALKQVLGGDLTKQFEKAKENYEKQASLLAKMTKALDNKLVILTKGVPSGGDMGLQVPINDLPLLPRDVDPAEWAADGSNQIGLSELAAGVARSKQAAGAGFQDDLAEIESYADQLTDFNQVAYELAKVYDLTIEKQLPGALREVQKKYYPSWNFRFMKAQVEIYQRERPHYAALVKEIEASRKKLPSFLH